MESKFTKFINSVTFGLKIRKVNLVRELNPFDRVYNYLMATFYCFGAIVGIHFYLYVVDHSFYFGPLATTWYIIGGIISVGFANVYGELVSRAPCSGGPYDYCYNTMGELAAFLTGWLMILSLSAKLMYSIRQLTEFIDKHFFDGLINQSIQRNVLLYNFSDTSPFERAPDLAAIPIGLVVAGLYSTVSRESAIANSVIVLVCTIIIFVTFTLFMIFIDLDTINIEPHVHKTTEFFAEGFSVVQNSYSGFELAIFLGEEAINPSVTIPRSALTATILATICYTVFSFIYCLLPGNVSNLGKGDILEILERLHMGRNVAWLVGLGGICGMTGASYSAMYSLVRLVYSMSKDGLLFRFLSRVHERTKSPIVPTFTIISILSVIGIFIKLKYMYHLSCFYISLEHLVVCICLMITRYRCEESPKREDQLGRCLLINYPTTIYGPTLTTERLSFYLILNAAISMCLTSLFIDLAFHERRLTFKFGFILFLFIWLLCVILLSRQPQNKRRNQYIYMGCVPFVPMFLLAHSILMLTLYTFINWLLTFIWLALGFMLYIAYFRKYSVEVGRVFPQDPNCRWDIMLRNEIIMATPSTTDSDEDDESEEPRRITTQMLTRNITFI